METLQIYGNFLGDDKFLGECNLRKMKITLFALLNLILTSWQFYLCRFLQGRVILFQKGTLNGCLINYGNSKSNLEFEQIVIFIGIWWN